MSEKRLHPRKTLQHPVTLELGAGGTRTPGICRDASLGGMFIETAVAAHFGAELKIHVTLPGMKEESTILAVVRWMKPDGVGVQFGVMGARATHALIQLIDTAV